ncbi:XdhC family protein [bacterium]|nr:XdhC family protein [candidate division CSSED10-310 bacterium]
MDSTILKTMQRIQEGGEEPAVLVIVVTTQESSPQIPGARMLVNVRGVVTGTVGGGTVEKLAVEHAIQMLRKKTATDCRTYDMNHGSLDSIATGMLCGGTITLYFERLGAMERLFLYGCGHIGGILAPMAAQCGFQVIAVDQRPEMATVDRFGGSDAGIEVQCAQPVEHAAALFFLPSDSIVIMTHNHQFDGAVLKALTLRITEANSPRYIGMIGSSKKVDAILQALRDNGVSDQAIRQIRTPIGLKIGGDSPAEIAISVMAEIIAARYGTIENGRVQVMSYR